MPSSRPVPAAGSCGAGGASRFGGPASTPHRRKIAMIVTIVARGRCLFGHFQCNRFVTLCPHFAPPLCAPEGTVPVFVSFFPQPRLFFLSAAAWSLLLVLVWFFGGEPSSARWSDCRRPPQMRRRSSASRSSGRGPSSGSTSISRSAWRSSLSSGGSIRRIPGGRLVDPRLCADPVRDLLSRCR